MSSGPTEILRPVICFDGPGGQPAHQPVACDWLDLKTLRHFTFRTSLQDGVQAEVDGVWHRLVEADIRVIENPHFTDTSLPWGSGDDKVITVRAQVKGRDPSKFDLTIGEFNDYPRSWIRRHLGLDILKFPHIVPTAVMALSMLRQQGVPC